MVSVSAAVRSRVCSLRSRPSIRTRGGEPTLQWRSEPPHSTSARRNGSIVRVEVTLLSSAGGMPALTRAEESFFAGGVRGLADHRDDVTLLDHVTLVDTKLLDRAG